MGIGATDLRRRKSVQHDGVTVVGYRDDMMMDRHEALHLRKLALQGVLAGDVASAKILADRIEAESDVSVGKIRKEIRKRLTKEGKSCLNK